MPPKTATQQKNADRAAVLSLVRALVGQLQASAEVDDTECAAMGCGTGAKACVFTGETLAPQGS